MFHFIIPDRLLACKFSGKYYRGMTKRLLWVENLDRPLSQARKMYYNDINVEMNFYSLEESIP
ncbi:hypothetical protein DWV16_05540 [Anaerotruncus sp. AF02-27]|jgi:hypothetical protein|nr:hypothetical protein DWV16_05540 [Anaerotruncus sp. AF02-27]